MALQTGNVLRARLNLDQLNEVVSYGIDTSSLVVQLLSYRECRRRFKQRPLFDDNGIACLRASPSLWPRRGPPTRQSHVSLRTQ